MFNYVNQSIQRIAIMNLDPSTYDNIADALAAGVDIDSIPECRQSIINDMDDAEAEMEKPLQTVIRRDPNFPIEAIPF